MSNMDDITRMARSQKLEAVLSAYGEGNGESGLALVGLKNLHEKQVRRVREQSNRQKTFVVRRTRLMHTVDGPAEVNEYLSDERATGSPERLWLTKSHAAKFRGERDALRAIAISGEGEIVHAGFLAEKTGRHSSVKGMEI